MKRNILIALSFVILSCNNQENKIQILEKRIDLLEKKISETYKPGFGEFMGNIQSHHSKLWFAGKNENWKLADFEVHEIEETLEAIQKYQSERKESKLITMINPAMEKINTAIKQKNVTLFKASFEGLTISCNECHQATKFEYNVVKIPDVVSFSNQDFKIK